jgi:hypothetical protein
MRRWLNRIITPPLMLVAALLLFFEELGWEFLERIMAALGRLPLIRSLEALVARLPPYGAAAVFLLPGLLLLPVKIGALWLIAQGKALAGLGVIVAAKLAGTALLARIFTLTRPALMRLAWFASLYGFVMRWRDRIHDYVKSSAAWQALQSTRTRLRAAMARMKPGRLMQRLRAIRRLRRRGASR